MTYKETVYLYVQWQVFSALVGVVKIHRRMVERRKIEPSQVHIPIGPLIDLLHAFVQDSRADSWCHQNNRHRSQQ